MRHHMDQSRREKKDPKVCDYMHRNMKTIAADASLKEVGQAMGRQ